MGESYLDLRGDGFGEDGDLERYNARRLSWGKGALDVEAEVHKRYPLARTRWTIFNPDGEH